MLRFIGSTASGPASPTPFKYISCYGLSYALYYELLKELGFKYISCYGLSKELKNIDKSRKKFKYISCYGLSVEDLKINKKLWYLNTSHVTVYPFSTSLCIKLGLYLNTSHVTVYLYFQSQLH